MANRDRDRTSQSDRSPMNDDEMVRGRSDDMDDMSNASDDDFEDAEDLEEDEEDEGNF
jgi:hypothetical protein